MHIIGLILAAGSSTRMSKSKQLLEYKGQSLIRCVAEKCMDLPIQQAYCVVGPVTHDIYKALSDTNIQYITNEHHDDGIGRSISVATQHILDTHQPDALLVMLTDQPLISISHYKNLIKSAYKNTDKVIHATRYNNKNYGVPAIFNKSIIQELTSIRKDQGAKALIKKYINRTKFIICEDAQYDIDTDEDYENLLNYRS